jgi:hypothetical protein
LASKTHRIRYDIIRSAAGNVYGKNHWDYLDPREVKTLAQAIGKACVNLEEYAAFCGHNFKNEITDRSAPLKNHQQIHFVRRELVDLMPNHIVERWTTF